MDERCWAGRHAFLSGKWLGIPPCETYGRHIIAAKVGPAIRLCDPHFEEANAAGYVAEPYIGTEEFTRRRPDIELGDDTE